MTASTEVASYLENLYRNVRKRTLDLVKPLTRDDFMVQSIPQASPPKWHLAHTTWFFDRFVLRKYAKSSKILDYNFDFLFNSYYETLGPYMQKISRNSLSRPSLEEVYDYRQSVDEAVLNVVNENTGDSNLIQLIELGINHEEQHQELLLMDIKINYYASPYKPSYTDKETGSHDSEMWFVQMDGGINEVGYGREGFSFDNERPRHRILIHPYRISSRPINNGEFIRFIEDGGYERPELWLSDGWSYIRENKRKLPLYWSKDGDQYKIFKLSGEQNLNESEPLVHVSYYEADAYARWAGLRLPTEYEWEIFAESLKECVHGNFMEESTLHPVNFSDNGTPQISGGNMGMDIKPLHPIPGISPL